MSYYYYYVFKINMTIPKNDQRYKKYSVRLKTFTV